MRRAWATPDPLLFLLCGMATVFGTLMIFDAGYARSLAQGNGPIPREFTQQVLYLFVAIFLGWLVSRWRIDSFRRGAYALFAVSVVSLLAVEFVGVTMNGAKRWLDIGFVVQPAEFAKIAVILFLAAVLASRRPLPRPARPPRDWAEFLDKVALPRLVSGWPFYLAFATAYLIEREPDLGTAAVVVFVTMSMMVFGGVSWRAILALLVIGGFGTIAVIKSQPYRMERIVNHAQRWQPDHVDDTGYQTTQSETAMASGGWTGVGIGAGRAKHMLPAATTDFILATIGEEFGLIGSLGVLGLLGAIAWRLAILALRAQTRFAMLVLAGTASWIAIQTCTNVVMANGLLPAIGIPLPFISSGGSSLLALWIAIGLCQSAADDRPRRTRDETDPEGAVEPLRGRVGTRKPAPREREPVFAE